MDYFCYWKLKVGEQLEFELGRYLYKRYKTLFKDYNHPSDKIYVRSSDKNRTILSAEYVVAGLFSSLNCKNSTAFQPIPIHTVPLKDDYVVYQKVKCNLTERKIKEFMQTDQYQEFLARHKKLIEYLEKNTQTKIDDLSSISLIYTAITIEHLRGLP